VACGLGVASKRLGNGYLRFRKVWSAAWTDGRAGRGVSTSVKQKKSMSSPTARRTDDGACPGCPVGRRGSGSPRGWLGRLRWPSSGGAWRLGLRRCSLGNGSEWSSSAVPAQTSGRLDASAGGAVRDAEGGQPAPQVPVLVALVSVKLARSSASGPRRERMGKGGEAWLSWGFAAEMPIDRGNPRRSTIRWTFDPFLPRSDSVPSSVPLPLRARTLTESIAQRDQPSPRGRAPGQHPVPASVCTRRGISRTDWCGPGLIPDPGFLRIGRSLRAPPSSSPGAGVGRPAP
jgi:hypothetical protein